MTAISPGKQRKKPKTRFSTDPEEESLGLEEGTKAGRSYDVQDSFCSEH